MSIQLVRVNEGLGKPRRTPWPETFTPHVIACLLTWTGDIETGKEWECEDSIFSRWIEDACHSGELVPVTTTEEIRMDYGQGNSFWDLAESPRETKVALHHIAAAPLAHWLESQDLPPGELLKAWFKAQGVGVAPPAPAKKETVPERNARWLKVWDEESPMHAPSSQARAIAKIVAAEGVERATVKKALQTAEKAREEARRGGNVSSMPKNKKAPASPFTTIVHRMK